MHVWLIPIILVASSALAMIALLNPTDLRFLGGRVSKIVAGLIFAIGVVICLVVDNTYNSVATRDSEPAVSNAGEVAQPKPKAGQEAWRYSDPREDQKRAATSPAAASSGFTVKVPGQ